MNILRTFLACSIIVELCSAQYLNDDEMNNYLRVVKNVVFDKIRSYGLSNLPDVNVKIPYNIADKMSYDIKGTLYLEDGFVMDLQDIILHDKDKTHYLTGSGTASVQTCIAFAGLTFFRDFRFEADEPEKIPDQAIGGVILRPEKFYFDLRIEHDLVKDTVKCTMGKEFQGKASKAAMEFYPNNTLTNRLRKERQPAGMFPDIGISWQKIIEPILDEVTQIIPFPPLQFPVERGH